ncbi:Golgi transport complex subunit 5-domain-containing protein [Lipomyces arxii]|uniref:Golgi transport complex subunit 5-domain-containing protein n=1 Tax=Lipomyces arxii TaxID=56418 RepID=UPI0034CD2B44
MCHSDEPHALYMLRLHHLLLFSQSSGSMSLPPTPLLPQTTTTDDEDDEYIDYALFTSPDFSPIAFCNSVVLATVTASDTEIDLAPARQRVAFDLEEVEKMLHTESVENHTALIAHAAKAQQAGKVLDTTKLELANVTSSFGRLEREVLVPYNVALPIYNALTKVHVAENLLRTVTWWIYLVRQFQAAQSQLVAAQQQQHPPTQQEVARMSVRAAKTFNEVNRHLAAFPRLRQVKVVAELEAAVVAPARTASSRASSRERR